MASASFRDSMNSLGWSRRADVPVNTSQQTGFFSSLRSLNPFGDGGYVSLPTTEGAGAPLPARSRREEDDAWFARKSSTPSPVLPSALSPVLRGMCPAVCSESYPLRSGFRVHVPPCLR